MDQMGRADQKGHKVSYFGTVGENGRRFQMNSQTGIDVQEEQKYNLIQ